MIEVQSTRPTKRLGRPTKFSAEIVDKICEHISDGLPMEYSAALCSISHETFHAWQRKYPRFREAVQQAIAQGAEARLKTIRDAAKTDWRAASWWLEHVLPEKFARNRIEVSGPNGEPIASGMVQVYLPQKEVFATERNGDVEDKSAIGEGER